MLILINNKFIPEKNTTVPINEGILYGYGIFETLRTYEDKKFFKAEEHINRLFASAKKIGLKIKYDKKQMLEMLKKIAKKSPRKKQRIKIIAIPKKIIIISQRLKNDKKIYNGVKCISVACPRPFPEIKSISYLPSLLSHKKAEGKGCFDAILIDDKGEIYEGAYSNIFWFENGTLCTRKNKILPGVTRKTILEISPFKTKFKTINIKELYKKKEVFITSSVRGIVPVTKIDNKKIGDGLPGKNTEELIQVFMRVLHSEKVPKFKL